MKRPFDVVGVTNRNGVIVWIIRGSQYVTIGLKIVDFFAPIVP
jgi:hypothetical protein